MIQSNTLYRTTSHILLWSSMCLCLPAMAVSFALESAVEGCASMPNQRSVFGCVVQMHEMLCASTVIDGVVIPGQDRMECLGEVTSPTIRALYDKALATSANDGSARLQQCHAAWKKSVSQILPFDLEPQYQYKLRRDILEQDVLYKCRVLL